MTDLITETELKEWSGYQRKTDLMNWLDENRIQYFYGKGGMICTTLAAINYRLIGGTAPAPTASNDEEIRFKA